MFKRATRLGLLALVSIVVLASGCTSPAPAPAAEPTRSITVVGQGKAYGTPDVVRTTVGVEARSVSIDEALADTNARIASILTALRQLGVADKDLQTSNFSVYLAQQSKPGVEETDGPLFYHVSNQVSVTLRDITKLGELLGQVLNSGANTVYGVSFGVDDTTALESEARADAVADAKSRAEALAGLNNVTLGRVLSVSEVISGSPGPLYDAARMSGAGAVPTEPGQMEITLSIQITYAIQ